MITIIHGDDLVRSRAYLQEQKQKVGKYIALNAEDVTIENLNQTAHGSGLFDDTKKVFVENFLSKTKLNAVFTKEIIEFINKNIEQFDIYFWEEDLLTKKTVFKDKKQIVFKLPQNIFSFVDGIKPSNAEGNVKLFHKALSESEVEQVFFMIIRQFRLLLSLCHPKLVSGSQIDEVARLAPWQVGKLQRQAKLFDTFSLKAIYKKLYEIDIQLKTGSLPITLTQSIDFLLTEI